MSNDCIKLATVKRFWNKVQKAGDDDCWLWTGAITSQGYGHITTSRQDPGGRRFIKAHRLSWEINVGAIPEGLIVRHYVCDNPPCVNPKHLRVGTKSDNMQDMVRHGRYMVGDRVPVRIAPLKHPRGSVHVHAKLTEDVVKSIRDDVSNGVSMYSLARKHNVSDALIHKVVHRKAWKHVA